MLLREAFFRQNVRLLRTLRTIKIRYGIIYCRSIYDLCGIFISALCTSVNMSAIDLHTVLFMYMQRVSYHLDYIGIAVEPSV